jgi:hypothetical protein
MGVQNLVLEAAAGHPIHVGPRGVAVQGKLTFLSEKGENPVLVGKVWKIWKPEMTF